MKKREGYVIWPEYFNKSLSRKYGRRIPKNYAIEQPTIEKIANVLNSLNLKYTIERDKAYPRRWWLRGGRIIVMSDTKKNLLLRKIAKKLKEIYKI